MGGRTRCNDEVEAQRRRWTFYEAILFGFREIVSQGCGKVLREMICLNNGKMNRVRGNDPNNEKIFPADPKH